MAVVNENTGCQMLTMYDAEGQWEQCHQEKWDRNIYQTVQLLRLEDQEVLHLHVNKWFVRNHCTINNSHVH